MRKFSKNEYTFERVKSAREGDVVYIDKGDYFEEVVISSKVQGRKWHDLSKPYETLYRMREGGCCWIEEIFKIKDSYTRSAGISVKSNSLSKEEQREEFIKLCEEIEFSKTPRFNMKDRY